LLSVVVNETIFKAEARVTPTEIKEKFDAITVWTRGGERAPHKPLLALYAIGRALRGEPRMVEYAQVDRDIGRLLVEFGPRRQSYHPEYPFWRLQNDRLWELNQTEGLSVRRGNTDAKKSGAAGAQCPGRLSAGSV
jgi:putative restriction endonuclease